MFVQYRDICLKEMLFTGAITCSMPKADQLTAAMTNSQGAAKDHVPQVHGNVIEMGPLDHTPPTGHYLRQLGLHAGPPQD